MLFRTGAAALLFLTLPSCDSGREPDGAPDGVPVIGPGAGLAPVPGEYDTVSQGLDGRCCGLDLLIFEDVPVRLGARGTVFVPSGVGRNREVRVVGNGTATALALSVSLLDPAADARGLLEIDRAPVRPGAYVYRGRLSGGFGQATVELGFGVP